MKNRIRALRKERGWTLAQLAQRIQPEPPTPQTIARLETGTRTLSITWLERIAAALEVTPQDLLTLSKGPTSPVIAAVNALGVKALTQPLEIDLTVVAQDPVALEFDAAKGRYAPGDILVFDRIAQGAAPFCDEALVKTQDGELLFGSYFPAPPGGTATLASPPPGAQLHTISALEWMAKAVCLIRRFD